MIVASVDVPFASGKQTLETLFIGNLFSRETTSLGNEDI